MFSYQIKTYGKSNAKQILIFPGLGISQKYGLFLGRLFAASGYQAHVFYYSDIFGKSIQEFSNNVQTLVTEALKLTNKKAKRNEFILFGTSMGSFIALNILNLSPNIKKSVINLCGDDFTLILTSWKKQFNNFKDEYFMNMKKSQIKTLISDLSPENNIDKLKDKKILYFMAEKDNIIPFKNQKGLLKKIKESNIEVTTIINDHHGHVASEAINIFKFNTYLNFLTKS